MLYQSDFPKAATPQDPKLIEVIDLELFLLWERASFVGFDSL